VLRETRRPVQTAAASLAPVGEEATPSRLALLSLVPRDGFVVIRCCVILGGTDVSTARSEVRTRHLSDAGDGSGEELNAVTVEVAAGAVVMFGGPGVGVAARICASRSGTPASRALVIAACRSECGLICRGIRAAFALRCTIRYTSRRSIGFPETGRSTRGPVVRSPRHTSAPVAPARSAR
jgi:hypothetical protein